MSRFKMMAGSVSLSSLGRNVCVGNLYDYLTDEILPSDDQVAKEFIHIEPASKTEISFFYQQPDEFKRRLLGINSHFDQNIESGHLELGEFWFAEFLENKRSAKNEAEVAVFFRVFRQTKKIDENALNSKMLEYQQSTSGQNSQATHIVEKVFYGVDIICSMRRPIDSSSETKEVAERNIYLAAKAHFEQVVGSSSISSCDPPTELNNVSCTVLSSLETDCNSTGGFFPLFSGWLQNEVNNRTHSPNKWRPIEIVLRPLPHKVNARLHSEKMKDYEIEKKRNLVLWDWIQKESHQPSSSSIPRIPPLERAIQQYANLLSPLDAKYIKMAHSSDEPDLEKVLIISNLLNKMKEWLLNRRKEIETISSLLEGSPLAMLDSKEMKNQSLSDSEKCANLFILTVRYVGDPLLDHLQELVGHPVTNKLPVFSIASTEKKRFEEIAKSFKEFAAEARLNPNMKYHIGLVSSSSFKDGDKTTIEKALSTLKEKSLTSTRKTNNTNPIGRNQKDIADKAKPSLAPKPDLGIRNSRSSTTPLSISETVKVSNRETQCHEEVDRRQQSIQKREEAKKREKGTRRELGDDDSNFRLVNGEYPSSLRIAEYFVENKGYSQLIQEGQPNIYLLNAQGHLEGEDMRWFNIGLLDGASHSSGFKDHKVIILMGATGCGKSTLINGMVNYILGVRWNDPFRFKIIRDDESVARNQAHSQTSSVSSYTIHHKEGMAIPYSVTIIDTPGYGDTNGVARDKKITQQIQQFLMQQEPGIDEIHAACFVAPSGESRLTVTQRYILDSVLSTFGKDFKKNIRLLVTFADNADPPVVAACQAAHFPLTSLSAGITYSKFNSSVLYASNREKENDDLFVDQLFWEMGQENFEKFFTMLKRMKGRDLKSTRKVIQLRQQLEKTLEDIEYELEFCLITIENLDMFIEKMKQYEHKMETSKNSVVEKTVIRLNKVKCSKGSQGFNCRKCQKTCPVFQNSSQIKCVGCQCPESSHELQSFKWRPVKEKVKTTLSDLKKEYESISLGKIGTKQLIEKCEDDLILTKGKVISLLDQVGANVRSLNSTAMRSNSALSPADYLSLMRSRVAEEQQPGYLTRLETLTELQQMLATDARFNNAPVTDGKSRERTQTDKPLNPRSRECDNVNGFGAIYRDKSSSRERPSASGNTGSQQDISNNQRTSILNQIKTKAIDLFSPAVKDGQPVESDGQSREQGKYHGENQNNVGFGAKLKKLIG